MWWGDGSFIGDFDYGMLVKPSLADGTEGGESTSRVVLMASTREVHLMFAMEMTRWEVVHDYIIRWTIAASAERDSGARLRGSEIAPFSEHQQQLIIARQS